MILYPTMLNTFLKKNLENAIFLSLDFEENKIINLKKVWKMTLYFVFVFSFGKVFLWFWAPFNKA